MATGSIPALPSPFPCLRVLGNWAEARQGSLEWAGEVGCHPPRQTSSSAVSGGRNRYGGKRRRRGRPAHPPWALEPRDPELMAHPAAGPQLRCSGPLYACVCGSASGCLRAPMLPH
ncbi:hypothetical protein GJAV_G00073930, partial [Gymnothorax javanicus]